MSKRCKTCNHYAPFQSVCCCGDSEDCAGYVMGDHCCEFWEEAPGGADTSYKLVDCEHNTWACEGCGHLETFEADGPYENGWGFCPHCGKPIAGEAAL